MVVPPKWSRALRLENEGLHLVEPFMPAHRHPLRHHVMTLFRRGDLASVAEAVLVSGLTRQTISRWLRMDRVDIASSRLRYVARQRDRAQRIVEGLPPRRRPSKQQMRKVIADAMAEDGEASVNLTFRLML